jgi:hypothetical protein
MHPVVCTAALCNQISSDMHSGMWMSYMVFVYILVYLTTFYNIYTGSVIFVEILLELNDYVLLCVFSILFNF